MGAPKRKVTKQTKDKSVKTLIQTKREMGLTLVVEARKGNLKGVIDLANRGAVPYLTDWVIQMVYHRF